MKDKIIIVLSILVLALSGFLVYDSFTTGMSTAEVKSEFADLKTEYQVIQKDLEFNINSLKLNNEVIDAQKKKIENILKKSEITEAELTEAKQLMRSISANVMDEYQKRVNFLQDEKEKLLTESLINENQLNELNNKVNSLELAKKDITNRYTKEKADSDKKTVLLSYASTLTLSNFELKSYKVRNSGKEIETEKASRISKIKVSFIMNENQIAESGNKELYIVVKNPDGSISNFDNVPSGTFVSGGKNLIYSDRININYTKGETKPVEFEWNRSEFKRGDYSIEVYENNQKKITKIGGARKTLE